MLECDMTCVNCFYSGESYFQEPVYGRTSEGEEMYADGVFVSSVICSEGPVPHYISLQPCQDINGSSNQIYEEPEYHRCGRGRWWENGKWIKWIDAEDSDGEA